MSMRRTKFKSELGRNSKILIFRKFIFYFSRFFYILFLSDQMVGEGVKRPPIGLNLFPWRPCDICAQKKYRPKSRQIVILRHPKLGDLQQICSKLFWICSVREMADIIIFKKMRLFTHWLKVELELAVIKYENIRGLKRIQSSSMGR